MNYFGDVYPLDEQKQFPSIIETANKTELLRISKSQLLDLCEKYPKIEILLMRLQGSAAVDRERGCRRRIASRSVTNFKRR